MEKLKKLDVIEHRLASLERKVSGMELNVTAVQRKNAELEKAVGFVSKRYDDLQGKVAKLDKVSDTIDHQEGIVDEIYEKVDKITAERDMLKDTVIDLQCRSMKNNLIFHGLGGEDNYEDTEAKLRDFL